MKPAGAVLGAVPCARIGLGDVIGEGSNVFCFGEATSSTLPLGPDLRLTMLLPITVAGVDPAAEARLAGLDRCVVSGRYLSTTDSPHARTVGAPPPGLQYLGPPQIPEIPVLASTQTFMDSTLRVRFDQAGDASGLPRGRSPDSLGGWQEKGSESHTADALYAGFLPGLANYEFGNPYPDGSDLWTLSRSSYDRLGPTSLGARTVEPDPAAYQLRAGAIQVEPNGSWIYPQTGDTSFASATRHLAGGGSATPLRKVGLRYWQVVGTYDPGCVPGFDPLAGGGLEAYSYPAVRLPHGELLGPSRAGTGYVSSPPLLLTTLAGAQFFADPNRFANAAGDAFISVVRVRVASVGSPGPVAEARLARVAAEIREVTGLEVDIVKGSSREAIQVALPAGRFGRPALTVTEQWSVKGVAVRFTNAVTAQNLALFVLVLVGAMVLVGQTSYMAVRRRRREFGVLRAVGWPAWWIALLVELEMLMLGLAVGLIALGVGWALAVGLRLQASAWQWLAAVPLAMSVAGLATLGPALLAAWGSTVEVIREGGRMRRGRHARSIMVLGVREMLSAWRTEGVLGAGAIALGSALLGGVILVSAAFRGQLDVTVLGHYLDQRVQPFHIALAALTLVIGALAAAEIVTLSYLERQPHLATLRALGWSRGLVLRLLAGQALALGLAGGSVGSLIVGAAGRILEAPVQITLAAASSSLMVALLATGLAAIVPLALAYRLPAAAALNDE